MSAKITIGVCVKESEKVIKAALMSIERQDYPHELMKLIIVDEDSRDKTLSVVKNFVSKIDIETVMFSSGGKGLGASRQIVVDNAEGDYIVWVDDDLVLKKDFIRNHVEFMTRNPSVGAAAGKDFPTRETLVDTLESICYSLMNPSPKAIATGGAIFRLKVIKQVGGFDIRIKGAGEDQDISHRIKEWGWTLSRNSSSEFYHKCPPTTFIALWKRHFWYGYGRHYRFHKYVTKSLLWEIFPPYALVSAVKDSCRLFKVTNERKLFLLPLHYFFRSVARLSGFIRAQLDGYGHIAINEG